MQAYHDAVRGVGISCRHLRSARLAELDLSQSAVFGWARDVDEDRWREHDGVREHGLPASLTSLQNLKVGTLSYRVTPMPRQPATFRKRKGCRFLSCTRRTAGRSPATATQQRIYPGSAFRPTAG